MSRYRLRELLRRIERKRVDEAAYPGNLGATEMVRFYRVATKGEIVEMVARRQPGKAFNMVKEYAKRVES